MAETFTRYEEFIKSKTQWHGDFGFETDLPSWLFDFQASLVDWALRKGRAAIFADCGLGKTPMQLAWAESVVREENKPVMIVTPLAVSQQTCREAEKFGVEAFATRGGRSDGPVSVWVTNYEQLHKYDPSMFAGCVCDESSAIKNASSAKKQQVVEFMRTIKYRLLCTATAAPNDVWELGTSSEALGYLGFRDMITKFFKQETQKDHLGWGRTKYRFRGHAEEPFWSWVCSWARSIRTPSDIGFDGSDFQLPDLRYHEHCCEANTTRDGWLFDLPASNMQEEREERRRTIQERCEVATSIAESHDGHTVLWCELNDEADTLQRMIRGSVQIKGSMSDDQREEYLVAFSNGDIRHLITKPKIGAWGLNWQHCHNTTIFPSHSFEQFYQAVRRFYRFGQPKPVDVHLITSEGQRGIIGSLSRKQKQADDMFANICKHMADQLALNSLDVFLEEEKVPSWL